MSTSTIGRPSSTGSGAAPTIVYIGGSDRSGSTLLALLLGEAHGVCAVGELRNLWDRGLRRNERCSCGAPFSECPFWRDVGARAFGGWSAVDVEWILAFQGAIDRLAVGPRWVVAVPRRLAGDVSRYTELYGRTYAAIAAAAGTDVVVDASKDLSHACILGRDPSSDLRIVHLVRDSRGVAYSWTRPRKRPEATGPQSRSAMVTVGSVRSALRWTGWNTCWQAMTTRGAPAVRLRYESLVEDPAGRLRQLANELDVPRLASAAEAIAAEGHVRRSAQHHVSGNPMRFEPTLQLRLDDEWRARMPLRDRAVVTALTWPLLLAYRYAPGWRG